ncbi:uncharacterized protein Tco025E_05491 [Trypanosoma conorhini]|uniref:GRAM domain-containing protein n=1 Tax=Trypanosoma conorhini TaxID=83891 RepID=A0A3R7PAI5_9TRYP|nr:uncharacterized protein Tco025E_05491 [Trypanosoma conorhini]RNF15520.1 hypothetical protein Tco025E_05491 [Trypanosoma conorhini]
MAASTKPSAGNGGYVELATLSYGGPVPKPHPPCMDPTPDEQYRQFLEQRKTDLGEREQRSAGTTTAAPGGHADSSNVAGLFSTATTSLLNMAQKVALKVERAGTEVSTATESAVRQMGRHFNVDRFKSSFPELSAMGEVLLADYDCAAMHAGLRVKGHMHITKNYLCFSAQTSSMFAQATTAMLKEIALASDGNTPAGIRQVIPLTEVACILLSVALETVDQGPPFFLPIPVPTVRPTSLQIYTTKQQLFQFLAFESIAATAGAALSEAVKGRPIDRAYNYLDHAWRAATAVPLPGVNYAS